MSVETIEAKIADFDAEVRLALKLEPGENWMDFTSEVERPDLFLNRRRLVKSLETARQIERLVQPLPRGSRSKP